MHLFESFGLQTNLRLCLWRLGKSSQDRYRLNTVSLLHMEIDLNSYYVLALNSHSLIALE